MNIIDANDYLNMPSISVADISVNEDAALAEERSHLTARQAGELARQAGARKLAPFHFSPRYTGREEELLAEAEQAFGGPIVRLPRGLEGPAD